MRSQALQKHRIGHILAAWPYDPFKTMSMHDTNVSIQHCAHQADHERCGDAIVQVFRPPRKRRRRKAGPRLARRACQLFVVHRRKGQNYGCIGELAGVECEGGARQAPAKPAWCRMIVRLSIQSILVTQNVAAISLRGCNPKCCPACTIYHGYVTIP